MPNRKEPMPGVKVNSQMPYRGEPMPGVKVKFSYRGEPMPSVKVKSSMARRPTEENLPPLFVGLIINYLY